MVTIESNTRPYQKALAGEEPLVKMACQKVGVGPHDEGRWEGYSI